MLIVADVLTLISLDGGTVIVSKARFLLTIGPRNQLLPFSFSWGKVWGSAMEGKRFERGEGHTLFCGLLVLMMTSHPPLLKKTLKKEKKNKERCSLSPLLSNSVQGSSLRLSSLIMVLHIFRCTYCCSWHQLYRQRVLSSAVANTSLLVSTYFLGQFIHLK